MTDTDSDADGVMLVDSEAVQLSEIESLDDADVDEDAVSDGVALDESVALAVKLLDAVADALAEEDAVKDVESDDDTEMLSLAVIDPLSDAVSDAEADGDGDSDGAPPPSHTARSDGIRHVTDENDADTTTHAAVVPSITISFPTVLFSKPVPLSVISVPPAVLPDVWDTDDTTSGYVSCGTPAASLANPALFANTFTTIGYSPAGAWSTVHRISVVEADVTLHTDTLPMYTKLSPISAPNPLPVITNSSPTVILDFDRAVTTGVRASSYV